MPSANLGNSRSACRDHQSLSFDQFCPRPTIFVRSAVSAFDAAASLRFEETAHWWTFNLSD
jgi:hypothetical protein